MYIWAATRIRILTQLGSEDVVFDEDIYFVFDLESKSFMCSFVTQQISAIRQ